MSVFMILKGFFGIEVGPINNMIDKFGTWLHLGFGGLTVMVLISVIIVSLCNGGQETISAGWYTYTVETSISIGWALIVAVLLNAGSWAAVFVLEKMGVIGDEAAAGSAKVSYVCSQCGAKAAKGAAFCNKCGGKVEEIVTLPMVYACSQCGAPSKAGIAFCNKCGGRIEGKEAPPKPVYACSQCGAPSKAGIAFCNKCGGKIEASVPAPVAAPAPAPVAAPAPTANVCSQCGAQLRPGAAFCNQCGNEIG